MSKREILWEDFKKKDKNSNTYEHKGKNLN